MPRGMTFSNLTLLLTMLVANPLYAAELPANFPSDVPVADYMEVVNVMQVGDDMMISFHAPGQTIASIVEWFQSGLGAAGWDSDGETISDRNAILAFSKNNRTCGVSVTNFVMNASMQMDETIKGVTLQISAHEDPPAGSSATTSDSIAEAPE